MAEHPVAVAHGNRLRACCYTSNTRLLGVFWHRRTNTSSFSGKPLVPRIRDALCWLASLKTRKI